MKKKYTVLILISFAMGVIFFIDAYVAIGRKEITEKYI